MKISEIAKSFMAGIRESIDPFVDVWVDFTFDYDIPEVPPISAWDDDGEEVSWDSDWEREVISQMESGDLRFYRDDIMMECHDVNFIKESFGRSGRGIGLEATVRTIIAVPRVLIGNMSDDELKVWLTDAPFNFQWDIPLWEEISFVPKVSVYDIQR